MQANKDNITYVRLDDQSEQIVTNAMKEKSLDKSSVIRMIIREWKQLKGEMISIPKAGIIIKDGKVELNPEYWNTEEGVEQSR